MQGIQEHLSANGRNIYCQTPTYIQEFFPSNALDSFQERSQILISCNPEYGAKQGIFLIMSGLLMLLV